MCTSKEVILPPKPAGPMPKLFILLNASFSIASYLTFLLWLLIFLAIAFLAITTALSAVPPTPLR